MKYLLDLFRGFRNWSLGMGYMVCCMLLGYWTKQAGQEIAALGPVFICFGSGVTGVVLMRAANKWAENGKGA